jgi:uncharacterized SAM-binding protein YcdF (DUF218 family)
LSEASIPQFGNIGCAIDTTSIATAPRRRQERRNVTVDGPLTAMEWTLFRLLDQIAKPSNVLLVTMALCILIALLFHRRWAVGLAALGMLLYMGASLVPIGEWLLIPLENRFAVAATLPPEVDGIVVVSPRVAGEIAQARRRLQGVSTELSALIELGRRYPDARLVLTGIGESTSAVTMSQRAWIEQFLEGQGFDDTRVIFADGARSNYLDMLTLARDAAAPRPGERWLLVQAAPEVPRAIGVARRLGWELEPWPVGFLTTGKVQLVAPHLRPTYYLYLIDVAVREYALLSTYHARGWTSELFPAPR